MFLELDTAPATNAVTFEELLDHLKLSVADDDDNVTAALIGSINYFDGRDGILNRALVTQTWKLHLDAFPASDEAIEVPLPPLQSIDSITYLDTDGVEQTLNSSKYRVTGGYNLPAKVSEAYGETWPSTRDVPGAVVVTFTAGYSSVPEPIKMAIKFLAADLYEHRQDTVIGQGVHAVGVVEKLVAPYKVVTFQ